MKKQIFRLALLLVTLCVFLCACASSVEEEIFDADFLGTDSGVDLNGFEFVYGSGAGGFSEDSVLGYALDTNFADIANQRIDDVEKQYNCKILFNYNADDFITAAVGGSFLSDVVCGASDRIADGARVGAVIGLSELSEFLDYRDEAKWGPRNLLEVVYYEDDLYAVLPFAWPELGFSGEGFGFFLVVNEDLVASVAATDPREYLENGTWNWAQFRKCLEAFTVIEGGETVQYGMSCHTPFFAEMYLRSNGSSPVKKGPNGQWVSGLSDERAMKAMQEANDVYYGELGYTIEKSTATSPGGAHQLFLDGVSVMNPTASGSVYGKNATVSTSMANFGILKWPVGPDADPDYTFSIYQNNGNTIAFSSCSRDPENAAIIIDALYEPLPGYETFDLIKEYMAHSYFFDERDCDTFFNLYLNQQYNYFHYGLRELNIAYFAEDASITSILEKNANKLQNVIDTGVAPSVSAIEALWGSYGE